MKRKVYIGLVCLFTLFFTLGCAGNGFQINISDEGKATLKEWVGFDLAAVAADKYPEIIKPGIKFCDKFLVEDEPVTIMNMWQEAIELLGQKFIDDELLARNLRYAAMLVTIQGGPEISTELIANYKAVVVGFKDGLIYVRDK